MSIADRIGEITSLAVQISENRDNPIDVFPRYLAHVREFELKVYLEGWSQTVEVEDGEPDFNYCFYLDRNDPKVEADKIYKFLQSLGGFLEEEGSKDGV